MRNLIKLLSFCIFLLTSTALHAMEIKGVTVAPELTQNDSGKKLVLNGAGVRTKFVFSIYVGALYLTDKSHDANAIITASSARSIQMHFLYDKVEKKKLTDGWSDGFDDNLSSDEVKRLKPRIDQFNSLFTDVVKGDVVTLDLLPTDETLLSMNNKPLGRIAGRDFQQALLKIWLGESPPNEDLKRAMLGIKDEN